MGQEKVPGRWLEEPVAAYCIDFYVAITLCSLFHPLCSTCMILAVYLSGFTASCPVELPSLASLADYAGSMLMLIVCAVLWCFCCFHYPVHKLFSTALLLVVALEDSF